VDICHVLGHGQEDVPLCTRVGGGAIGGCAEALGETGEARREGSSVEAMPVLTVCTCELPNAATTASSLLPQSNVLQATGVARA
jgi:hypothetical protein